MEPIKDIPVFELKGNETGKVRKLHCNHFFLVDYQVRKTEGGEMKDDKEEIEVTEDRNEMDVSKEVREGDVTSESSDNEDGVLLVPQTVIHGDAREQETQSQVEMEEPSIEDQPDIGIIQTNID
jgi:hypothetical protein